MQKNNLAIILSGGTGKRFDISKPKQFYKLNKKTIIETTVEKFVNSNLFNYIIVVSHKDFLNLQKIYLIIQILKSYLVEKIDKNQFLMA